MKTLKMDIDIPITNKKRMLLVIDDEPDIITSSLKISLEYNGFIVHAFITIQFWY
jgi:hypothetical protein